LIIDSHRNRCAQAIKDAAGDIELRSRDRNMIAIGHPRSLRQTCCCIIYARDLLPVLSQVWH